MDPLTAITLLLLAGGLAGYLLGKFSDYVQILEDRKRSVDL